MTTIALIPAHNEAATIRAIVAGARAHLDTVLVIDDGSTDATAAEAEAAGARVVRHEANIGKGQRLAEGLSLAAEEGATAILTLDADGQHDPADTPAFFSAAQRYPGAIILGDRSGDMAKMPGSRSKGIKFGNFFIGWACARRIPDAQCGMRLYPASAWRSISIPARDTRGFLFETAILMHAAEQGISFATVPIPARYEGFVQRPSHFRPIRDFVGLFGLVTRFLVSRGLRPRGLLIALGLKNERNHSAQERSS